MTSRIAGLAMLVGLALIAFSGQGWADDDLMSIGGVGMVVLGAVVIAIASDQAVVDD